MEAKTTTGTTGITFIDITIRGALARHRKDAVKWAMSHVDREGYDAIDDPFDVRPLGHDGWAGYPLQAELEDALGKPVRVANDADVQGLAVSSGRGVELVVTYETKVKGKKSTVEERVTVPLGALIKVDDGETVAWGQLLAEWDPHNDPVLATAGATPWCWLPRRGSSPVPVNGSPDRAGEPGTSSSRLARLCWWSSPRSPAGQDSCSMS